MIAAHDTQALAAIRDNARKFAEKHAAALARELIDWQDTALLCGGQGGGGKLRELAEMVAPFATDHSLQVAESMAKRAALEALASRLQEQEGQPALSALADSWDDSAESDHSDHGKTLSACADELRATLAAGSQAVQVPGWVSIDDRLPEEGSTVICWAGGTPYLAYLLWGKNASGALGQTWTQDGEPEEQPTHWMPLPAAPLQPLADGEVTK